MIHFFPGCQLEKNHADAWNKMNGYMKSRGVSESGCCRQDLDYLKPGDTVVTICTLCDLIIAEKRPDVNVISLCEYVLGDPDFKWADLHGKRLTIQDCMRTSGNARLQDAARECLRRMGAEIVETSPNRAQTDYCGVWLNNPAVESAANAAPRTFQKLEQRRHLIDANVQQSLMREWCARYETEEIAVYCIGCEKGIRLGGLVPRHMIDLLAERCDASS